MAHTTADYGLAAADGMKMQGEPAESSVPAAREAGSDGVEWADGQGGIEGVDTVEIVQTVETVETVETIGTVEEPQAANRGRPSKHRRTRRYLLVLPETLYQDIEQIAAEHETSVVDIMRRFLRLGVIGARLQETSNARLVIKEGDTEREIFLL